MNYYYHPSQGQQPPTPPVGQPMGYPMYSPMDFEAVQRQKAEKKEIRRRSNALGAGLLFVQGIGTILALLIPVILDLIFPGASTNGGIYYDALEYAFYSPVSILLSMWIGMKFTKTKLGDVVPFGKANPLLWIGCILFAFLFVLVGNLAGDLAGMLSPYTVENMNAALGAEPETLWELLLSIMHMAAIPALVEELAFRGIALGLLRPYGDKFAIVMSALLFGVLHGNFIQIPFAFFIGLILAYAVVRTGSIVPAILIHFINNAMSCVLSYYAANVGEEMQLWFSLLLYAAWLFLGLLGFCLLKFCFPEKLTQCCTPYEGCISTGRRTGVFFSGAALIVALAVYGLSAVLFAFPLPGLS